MSRRFTIQLISALLILLFTYTGLSKFIDQERFAFTLSRSPLLQPFASFIAWALPLAELFIALLLFIPRLQQWGLRLSLVLLVAMTLYLGYMVLFSSDLPCACGGVISQLSWGQHILFNLGFVALTAYAIIRFPRRILLLPP